jgi:MYXO-CTERM domain-containing protein
MMSRLRLALLFTIAVPSVASAHIQLVKPNARINNGLGGEQKNENCGSPGWVRAQHPDRVTYFKPGETIRVMWQETILHPGWYRIALHPNGENFHVPPPSNGPGDDGNPSNFPTLNMTGMTDAATGTMILADRIPDAASGTTNMMDVKLPDMECANCTLQLTQFMLSSGLTAYNIDSIYFNCADIVISNNPPPTPGTPDAGPVTPDAGAPTDDNDVKGGCSTSGASGLGLLAGIGLLGLVARRRRAAAR